MKVKLHERVHVRKTRSNEGQYCIHCGKLMPEGTIGLSFTKKIMCGNTMNLWCHVKCFNSFFEEIKDNLGKNAPEIVSNCV